MINLILSPKKRRGVFFLLVVLGIAIQVLLLPIRGVSQKLAGQALEKMPPDLERDFALSALPLHLRKGATVYLLDPAKGFYIDRQGTNGFVCFVSRTEWEWGEFRQDLGVPISYDATGARAIFSIYRDVAAMRASGKFTALQIKDSVIDRIHKGIYKAPSAGISYMLGPLMRGYPGNPDNNEVMTMSMPHYMLYAPYIKDDAPIGGTAASGPFIVNPGNTVLGSGKGPYGYIILPAGETETERIMKANNDLLKRLAAYKPYYKLKTAG